MARTKKVNRGTTPRTIQTKKIQKILKPEPIKNKGHCKMRIQIQNPMETQAQDQQLQNAKEDEKSLHLFTDIRASRNVPSYYGKKLPCGHYAQEPLPRATAIFNALLALIQDDEKVSLIKNFLSSLCIDQIKELANNFDWTWASKNLRERGFEAQSLLVEDNLCL